MEKTSVSIIVVHYSGPNLTRACLKSIDNLDTKNLDISLVLVNNASTDWQEFTSNQKMEIVSTVKNLGFTGGHNLGMSVAENTFHPKYYLLLNNDAVLEPQAVLYLVDVAKSQKKVGAVSPKIYFSPGHEFHKSYSLKDKGKVIWFAGGAIDWKNVYAYHRGVDEVDRGQTQLPAPKRTSGDMPYVGYETMDFATGCCVLLPSKVIEEVGMFDQDYFLYWEDVDLSVRIAKAGYHLWYAPLAVVWHDNAGSTGGSGSALHQKYQERNRLRFAIKYAPLKSKILVMKDYLGF